MSYRDEIDIYKQIQVTSGNTIPDLEEHIRNLYGVEGINRYKFAQIVMTQLGLDPSPDALLVIACTSKSKTVIATAGAGKTTMLHIDLIVTKLYEACKGTQHYTPISFEGVDVKLSRILYLNYNRHNMQPIIDKHSYLVNTLASKGVRPHIDSVIESSTVHKFCRDWLVHFKSKLGLNEISIITEEDKLKLWGAIISPRWSKYYTTEYTPDLVEKFNTLYTFKEESLQDWDEFFQSTAFVDSELHTDLVKSCLSKYDSLKSAMKQIDFIDLIKIFIQLMETDEEVRTAVHQRYSLIIADEVQDFTTLMNKFLLTLQHDNARIMAVGDVDQTIYAYKGADPYNIVKLASSLKDCTVLGLDTNYRCPKNIGAAALKILEMNKLRFDKPISFLREGGGIDFHPYSSTDEKLSNLVRRLKLMSPAEQNVTVVAYRNNESGTLVAEELFYEGVPFTIMEDYKPFTHPAYRKFFQVLRALREQSNSELNKSLYTVLPIKREAWEAIVNDHLSRRISFLEDFDFTFYSMPASFADTWNVLLKISNLMDTSSLCSYYKPLLYFFRLYYFDFVYRNDPIIEQLAERLERYLNRDITFDKAESQLAQLSHKGLEGVRLSTIHTIKGLEFNNVLILDLNESIFPNYSRIEQLYSSDTAFKEKEAENRLFYVLLTRAREHIDIYYDINDPSIYINQIKPAIATNPVVSSSVLTEKVALSKMSFINKLTRR